MHDHLLLRLEIPILATSIVATPGMIFDNWFPLDNKDFLLAKEDGLSLTLWFDEKCTRFQTREELSHWLNPMAHFVNADVVCTQISPELASCIASRAARDHHTAKKYNQQYTEFARRLYVFAIKHFNRLVAYVRTYKGQYWLQEYSLDTGNMGSAFVSFKAKAKLGDSDWLRWDVPNSYNISCVGIEQVRYIDKSSWSEAMAFVNSSRRPFLVLDLLSDAEWLAGIGHRRSALTQAVTALEVAISHFAKGVNVSMLEAPTSAKRTDWGSLKGQIEHLGISGTVRYLLPIILPARILDEAVLTDCQEALTQRQNVVHQGQRDIDPTDCRRFLRAIRQMCEILRGLTSTGASE